MSNTSDLVSILIPCFNAAFWLSETLNSCLAQSYCRWEAVIVDDGSTDDSAEIARQFAQRDNRFQLFRQSNSGAPVARNRALKESQGELIQYLDADDPLAPNKLSVQVDILRRESAAVITCPWAFHCREPSKLEPVRTQMDTVTHPIEWLQTKFETGQMNHTSCWLTRRALIERAGPWNESLLINQDGEFFARVLLATDRVLYTSDTLALYRRENPTSVSRLNSEQKAESLLDSYEHYERSLRRAEESERTREALACNYLRFIYAVHPDYPLLLNRARALIERLRVKKLPQVGSRRFRYLESIIGFDNALRLRNFHRFSLSTKA